MKKTKSRLKSKIEKIEEVDFSKVKSALFIRLRSLGDCVLMTPSLRIFRTAFPSIKTAILVEEPYKDVFLDNPFVDELWVLRKGLGAFDAFLERLIIALRVRKNRYDIVLNFHGGTTSLFFTWLSNAPIKAGFSRYRGKSKYTHLVEKPERFFGGKQIHTVQYQAALLAGLGIELPETLPAAEIYIPDEVNKKISKIISEHGLENDGFILIHPTATLETKRWPPRKFAQLIKMIQKRFSEKIILTCGQGEEWVIKEIFQALDAILPYFSNLSVKELSSLISYCKVFIGCDSGPTHIASALGKPVCVIFGSSNPVAWGPWRTDNHSLVRLPLECSPCAGYHCKVYTEPRCILDISPENVFDSFCDLLG